MVKTINGEVQFHALVDGKKIIISEASVKRDLQLEDAEGVDCLPNSAIFEQLTLMGIYVAPYHTKKIFGNMRRVGKDFTRKVTDLFPTMLVQNQMGEGSAMPTDPQHTHTFIQSSPLPQKTQKPRKPNRKDTQVPQPNSGPTDIVTDKAVHKELGDSLVRAATTTSSLEAEQDSGGGPRRQETIGDTIAQTRIKNASKLSNDSLLARGSTLQSDEDRLKLNELMELCTNLPRKVGVTTWVESSVDEEDLGEDASKQGRRINVIDADEDITLVIDDADKEMFDVDALNGEEVFVAGQNENVVKEIVDAAQVSTATTTVTITTKEVTLAQALADLKSQTVTKCKGILIEPMKPMKKKNQIRFDEETALNLQDEFDEEERLAREKVEKEKEANIVLIETWDDIQEKIDADHQLAERLQA
ncbi:hypothetical protein Tco_1505122 [Tanacetum coccineum]